MNTSESHHRSQKFVFHFFEETEGGEERSKNKKGLQHGAT